MPRRLLLIQQRDSSKEEDLGSFLFPEGPFRGERDYWDSFCFENVLHSTAHLVVAAALPLTTKAIDFFSWLATHSVSIPTFAILPNGVDERTLQATCRVVDDFMLCPIRKDEFHTRLTRILGEEAEEIEMVQDRLTNEIGLGQLVGRAPAFLSCIEKIPLMAKSDVPVLITGETGTGKELCARAIHHLSQRRNHAFIPVDCSALPEHLFENELFGHARGAYTDAHTDQKGLAAMADGGTLFLDEIDALSLIAQAKLLRFLQENTYKPLGAERFVKADVKVIAAANRDLESCVREKQFRSDLYFRLNVLRLQLPPLRERSGDIESLSRHFLRSLCAGSRTVRRSFSVSALRKLEAHDWPGNIRELFNVVQRAFVFCEGSEILPRHISSSVAERCETAPASFRQARAQALGRFERSYVEELLQKHGGNVTRAAAEARKDRRAFGRLIKKYQIRH